MSFFVSEETMGRELSDLELADIVGGEDEDPRDAPWDPNIDGPIIVTPGQVFPDPNYPDVPPIYP